MQSGRLPKLKTNANPTIAACNPFRPSKVGTLAFWSMERWQKILFAALSFLWLCCHGANCVNAEEPYKRFLEKLRQERLFDIALVYLEELESGPGVSSDFKQEILLERGMLLYQAGALYPAKSPNRIERLDGAEKTLREFLDSQKDHPRRGEARLKLGELLLTRAEEARAAAADPTADALEAIKFYDQAHQLFESTINELAAVLEQIKGNRIDPSNTEMVAYRTQVQQDLRQAQLFSAKAIEERGRSHGGDQTARTRDLEQAMQMYSDLYSKEQRNIGIRNYALFYRSGVQTELAKIDDAVDGYQRIVDLEGDGTELLRPLQTEAVTMLLPLFATQNKFELAVDRATAWLASLRPEERSIPEALNLQLELAKLRLAWGEALRKQDPEDRLAERLMRDVRNDLRGLLRTPGGHLEPARELLSQLGVETTAKAEEELPKIKDFEEGLAEAQKRIDEAESDALGIEVLRTTISDEQATAEARSAAEAELESLQTAIAQKREAALAILREALRLLKPEDDRTQLFEARFRIAFLLLKLDRPWDAMVVGEFLARGNPGTETGLRAASITLASFSVLLSTAGDDKSGVIEMLSPFAEFLIATWPQSTEAAASAAALAQLSILTKDWDSAERYLGLVPEGNEAIGKQRRDLGISFYVEYLRETQQNAGSEQAAEFRKRAIKWLEFGLTNVTPDKYDSAIVDSINALVRLQLQDDRVADAAKWLLADNSGLIDVLESKPDLVAPKAAMESLRTAIQVVTAQLADGSIEQEAAVTALRSHIEQLQVKSQATPEGAELLTGISVALARDMKEKLSATKDVAKRTRLSQALLLVIGEAAKSESFNTQYWAGTTEISLAEDLAEQQGGREAANKAFAEGAGILQSILDKEAKQAGWIQPPAAKIQIRVALAKALRGTGDFQSAVLKLGEILDDNNALLDVQIAAAETLQAWGRVKPEFYRAAIMGGRKKNGQNVIWGWGRIAQMTTNQPNFTEQFYNARYQLALSRFRYAQSLTDNEQKMAETRKAEKDITSTATLYPELGGETQRQAFNTLLKEIKQALGS